MDISLLQKWSEETSKKNNNDFKITGVKDNKIVKVRAYLRGIQDCTKIVIKADNERTKCMNIINGYLVELGKIGISFDGQPEA